MTATINNNTVSMNTSEVLPALLRLCDPEDLAYYNDMTPTTLDYLGNYADGVERLPYQLTMSDNNPADATVRGNNRPIVLVPTMLRNFSCMDTTFQVELPLHLCLMLTIL
jgi:hypothetical protein